MAAVFARSHVGKRIGRDRAQPKRVIKLAIGEQTGIGRDDGTAKLEDDAALEIESQNATVHFTRRVRRV